MFYLDPDINNLYFVLIAASIIDATNTDIQMHTMNFRRETLREVLNQLQRVRYDQDRQKHYTTIEVYMFKPLKLLF